MHFFWYIHKNILGFTHMNIYQTHTYVHVSIKYIKHINMIQNSAKYSWTCNKCVYHMHEHHSRMCIIHLNQHTCTCTYQHLSHRQFKTRAQYHSHKFGLILHIPVNDEYEHTLVILRFSSKNRNSNNNIMPIEISLKYNIKIKRNITKWLIDNF